MTALTDLFPIGFSSRWGGFRSVETIPLRFGPVRGRCVQYQTANIDIPPRKFWVWSDGACAGVDAVYIGGQERIGGWQASNQMDVTGKAVMMIEFAEPVAQDTVVTAAGRGQIRNGVIIRNPARVIAELANFAGVIVDNLDYLEVECARLGIELAGEIASEVTIQRAIRSVCESIGAIYSPRMRDTAALYPGGNPELANGSPRIRADITPDMIIDCDCELSDVVNVMSVSYGLRDGKPSKTMTLESPASILAYGRRTGESFDAQWIADDGVMANIASRILRFASRPSYRVSVDSVPADLRPGDWVSVDGEGSPAPFASGERQMIATAYDPDADISSGIFEVWADPAPSIIVTGQASLLEEDQAIDTTSSIIGDRRQVQLKGSGGRPLNGAKCVLDGNTVRYANAAGIVEFPLSEATPGWHDLTITLGTTAGSSGSAGNPDFGENNGDNQIGTTGGSAGTSGAQVAFTIRVLFQ